MAKLTLVPEPVFKAPVPIPVPGGEPVEVVFHFLHKDQSELQELIDQASDQEAAISDVDVLMEICCDWDDIDQPFSRESLEIFDKNWHGGARAVFDAYICELKGIRRKK